MPFDITSKVHNPHCHKGCFHGGKNRTGLQTLNIDCSKTLLVVESVEQYICEGNAELMCSGFWIKKHT